MTASNWTSGPTGYPVRTSTPADLHDAQRRRDGRLPLDFDRVDEHAQEKFRDAHVSGRGPRLESWHGDHTDLVHVIWDHSTLKGSDADNLASAIRASVYDDARRAHDQVNILVRLEALITDGADPAAAITTLKTDLIGDPS